MICGIALSTTSVAVVYAVMIETGLNETDFGKLILAACFVTDLGTVVALGVLLRQLRSEPADLCGGRRHRALVRPRIRALVFCSILNARQRARREDGFLHPFWSGSMATMSNSEAVLPAYMVGLALAGVFVHQRDTIRRLRTTVFAFLTPFYFLNAGMKVHAAAVWSGLGLIVILLVVKLVTKMVGVWPLTRMFPFGTRESYYTTLLMSTGLTFGTIRPHCSA